MLSQDLIALLQARRFAEAADGIREHKPRLKSVSLSHPVFHLLKEYRSSGFDSFSSGYHGLDANQRAALHRQMEGVLVAMIEGGMDMKMLAEPPKNMSYQEEERSALGIGSASEQTRFDKDGHTLYVRLAGLGWTHAMQILLERGYTPSAEEIDVAVLNSVRSEKADSLVHLLSMHEVGQDKKWYFSSKLLDRLVKWDGVPPQIVSKLVDAFSVERAYGWVSDAHDRKGSDKTAVEWLSDRPGKWKQFHEEILLDEIANPKDKANPGLWTALFRHFVKEGEFQPLLEEALNDGSFAAWSKRTQCAGGINLSSWLAQGGALSPPPERVPNYMGELPPETPPEKTLAAQLRRTIGLIGKLELLGCGLRLGDTYSETEGMAWSSRGFAPKASFVRRHPEVLQLSSAGQSPVHTASVVDVALAWESIGASSAPNHAGEDPWVMGMQKDNSPAPWAREIANRIKSGRVSVHSIGTKEADLLSVATKSPPLARLLLKKAKVEPSVKMVEATISNGQFGLLREWIDEGVLDRNPSLRPAVFELVSHPPSQMSDNAEKTWRSVLDSVRVRPGKPWPEQIAAWKELADQGRSRGLSSDLARFKEGMEVLRDWGPNARDLWGDQEWDMLPSLVNRMSTWKDAIPIELTTEEAVELFWKVILNEEEGATRSSRLSNAQKVWDSFDRVLPISISGLDRFAKLKELDECQLSGGFASRVPGFEEFLEAEELVAGSVQYRSTSRSPGRRL